VAEDRACQDLLVSLLRGKHIARYKTNWDGTWMIATFPALEMDETELPLPIFQHLSAFRERLEPKPPDWTGGKWNGRKSGSYQWFETQDTIAYHEQFRRPKIMYPNMTKYLPFYLDESGAFFGNQKCFIITSERESLTYLAAMFNSSLFRCCFKDNFPELLGNTYELSKIFVEKIPIKYPDSKIARTFDALVPLIQRAKREELQAPAQFLEDLVDACVMECYFREHMAERELLFLGDLAPHLEGFDSQASQSRQVEFIEHLHRTLNAADSPIRNRLLRLTADSPDLLAIIKQEGQV